MTHTIYLAHTERLEQTQQKVRELLSWLPQNLLYHDAAHTLDPVIGVAAMANRYSLLEKIPEHSRELVVAAALGHDLGYLEQYSKNEPIGARIVGEIYPSLGYNDKEISITQNLIIDTDISLKPRDRLSEILRDADVDNLGREDFFEKSDRLRRELGIDSIIDWLQGNIKFLEGHRYFTASAQELRNARKEINYQALARLVAGG